MRPHPDFANRRAIKGQGQVKRILMQRLWELENEITHYIIAFVAGKDPVQDENRRQAEVQRAEVHAQLRAITMDPK